MVRTAYFPRGELAVPDKESKRRLLSKFLFCLVPFLTWLVFATFILEVIHADTLMAQVILRVFPPADHRSSDCRAWKPRFVVGSRSMMVGCESCGESWAAAIGRDDHSERLHAPREEQGDGNLIGRIKAALRTSGFQERSNDRQSCR
jgi:hypothetical protein